MNVETPAILITCVMIALLTAVIVGFNAYDSGMHDMCMEWCMPYAAEYRPADAHPCACATGADVYVSAPRVGECAP